MPGSEFETDAALIGQAARDAGAVALNYFKRDPKVWTKDNNSPVSEADLAVDAFLRERLGGARPEFGWLSEETDDTRDRLSRDHIFVVDPIDGTRAFIDGRQDWTVSIAVVADGRPIAAALYAPVHDELFVASAGSGAMLNGETMAPGTRADLAGARVAGPRSILRHTALKEAGINAAGFIPSLAYRLALVGTGRFDAAVARPRAHDWDIAAADLIVTEAGGRLTDTDGRPIRYNTENLRHPALVASSADLHDQLTRLVADATSD